MIVIIAVPESQGRRKVVVIGAGVIGSCIAFNLSLRDVDVTVLDAGEPGQAASLVSFAWANALEKGPRHYHDLNRRSVDMWYRLAHRLGEASILALGGEMRWSTTIKAANELQARVCELQSWGYPIRLLGPSEVNDLEPGIVTNRMTAASYTDIEFHVDASAFVRTCLAEATRSGAKVMPRTRVTNLHLARTKGQVAISRVDTGAGELDCDVAVLACGADTSALAAYAGLDVPFGHTFGATIVTTPIPPIFKSVAVVHTPRDRQPMMNLRQFKNGAFMIHGGSHGGSIGRADRDAELLLQSASEYLPGLKGAQIAEIRRGRRPMPEDGYPILGFSKVVPNLYFAAMHSGVSLAALVGEFASSEIVDGARIDLLEPYRVDRFL